MINLNQCSPSRDDIMISQNPLIARCLAISLLWLRFLCSAIGWMPTCHLRLSLTLLPKVTPIKLRRPRITTCSVKPFRVTCPRSKTLLECLSRITRLAQRVELVLPSLSIQTLYNCHCLDTWYNRMVHGQVVLYFYGVFELTVRARELLLWSRNLLCQKTNRWTAAAISMNWRFGINLVKRMPYPNYLPMKTNQSLSLLAAPSFTTFTVLPIWLPYLQLVFLHFAPTLSHYLSPIIFICMMY